MNRNFFASSYLQSMYFATQPYTGLPVPTISYSGFPDTISIEDSSFTFSVSSTNTFSPIFGSIVYGNVIISQNNLNSITVILVSPGEFEISLNQIADENYDAAEQVLIIGNIKDIEMPAALIVDTSYYLSKEDLNGNVWNINYSGLQRWNVSSYVKYYTDASSVTIFGISTWSRLASFSSPSISVQVNGAFVDRLIFDQFGIELSKTIPLPGTGIKLLEIFNGCCEMNGSDILGNEIQGSSLTKVIFPAGCAFRTLPVQKKRNRIIFGIDSLSSGVGATNPELEGYVSLLRKTHVDWEFLMLSYGGRKASRIVVDLDQEKAYWHEFLDGAENIIFYNFSGTNDYQTDNSAFVASNIGTVIDAFHTEFPTAKIYIQTMYNIDQHVDKAIATRAAVTELGNTRPWLNGIIDGTTLSTNTGNQTFDGVHLTTLGYQIVADNLNRIIDFTIQQ